MTTNSYHRAVINYLQENYHINPDLERKNGSRHYKLRFLYNGIPRTIVLHEDARSSNILPMKLADIRRELGPPPTKTITKIQRSLEDMMPMNQELPVVPENIPNVNQRF